MRGRQHLDYVILILSTIQDARLQKGNDLEIDDILSNILNLKFILRLCMNNRVLYSFVSSLKKKAYINGNLRSPQRRLLTEIWEVGNLWIDRLHNTINYVNNAAETSGTPVLFIKTLQTPQDVTFDVDVLLRRKEDFLKIRPLLKGFEPREVNGGYELCSSNEHFLPIDLYYDIRFQTYQLVSPEFLWSRVRTIEYGRRSIIVPAPEGELILHASQLVFQNKFLTIGNILNIASVITTDETSFDWSVVLKEGRLHGWEKELSGIVSIVNSAYSDFFGKPVDASISSERKVYANFPIFLPPAYNRHFVSAKMNVLGLIRFLLQDHRRYIVVISKHLFRNKIPIYRDWVGIDSGL